MGRKKEFGLGYSRKDAMVAIGYEQPNNSRMNRVMRLLAPAGRYLSGPEVFRACLLDQCLDAGCNDLMAVKYAELAFNAVADDLLAGERDRVGYLVLFQGLHQVLKAAYIHEDETESLGDFFADGRLADGRPSTGIVLLDLAELMTSVKERLQGNIERFRGKYSAQEIEDALKSAKNLIDEIEAAHK